MSELKADKTFVFGEECEAYKKAEADKVIAEKDKEIAELKERVSEERSAKVDYKISANDLSDGLKEAYEEIKHHKYKRCVDKAEMCGAKCDKWMLTKANAIGLGKDGVEYFLKARRKVSHYMRWQQRWLKITAQFSRRPT